MYKNAIARLDAIDRVTRPVILAEIITKFAFAKTFIVGLPFLLIWFETIIVGVVLHIDLQLGALGNQVLLESAFDLRINELQKGFFSKVVIEIVTLVLSGLKPRSIDLNLFLLQAVRGLKVVKGTNLIWRKLV